MDNREFWMELKRELELPFDTADVTSVAENCGTTWIEMKDGSTYFLTIQKCEDEKMDDIQERG